MVQLAPRLLRQGRRPPTQQPRGLRRKMQTPPPANGVRRSVKWIYTRAGCSQGPTLLTAIRAPPIVGRQWQGVNEDAWQAHRFRALAAAPTSFSRWSNSVMTATGN